MGGGNLGDDTTQTAVISNIRLRWPDATIIGLSMNPDDTQSRHGIPAFPIRRRTWINPDRDPDAGPCRGDKAAESPSVRAVAKLLDAIAFAALRKPRAAFSELLFLAKSFSHVRTIDILVISGGGQLLDSWGGPWEYPFTIFKWVLLAKLARVKCYFVNVGAGPLRHRFSRALIRHALSLADYVSFRDHRSRSLAEEIGYRGEAQVFPDCVYGLDLSAIRTDRSGTTDVPVVGMSPMAYCDPRRYWIKDQDAYEAFVRKLVEFGSRLANDHRLTLFSTDIWFDAQTLEKLDLAIKAEMDGEHGQPIVRENVTSLEALLLLMSRMDYVITCRFHGVVFAHLMNTPVIALSHHSKVTTLMADLGLSEYCLDIDTFDQEQLAAAFARMVADRTGIRDRMAAMANVYKSGLKRQFDQLFPPEATQ